MASAWKYKVIQRELEEGKTAVKDEVERLNQLLKDGVPPKIVQIEVDQLNKILESKKSYYRHRNGIIESLWPKLEIMDGYYGYHGSQKTKRLDYCTVTRVINPLSLDPNWKGLPLVVNIDAPKKEPFDYNLCQCSVCKLYGKHCFGLEGEQKKKLQKV